MKILTLIVPCYNSEDYMERCINSLLLGGKLVEIIIVDDGSTDKTASIADEYGYYYPDIVKVVHQKNGGHGQAINAGLKISTGQFVKIVDSDDWLNASAYSKVLDFLINDDSELEMLISNYVYEKSGAKRKKVINYSKFMPENKYFSWQDVKFPLGKYLLMHSVIYRTEVLKKMNLQLPQHTFYVDNLFVFQPLPEVHQMFYLNVNLYRYFIGREDQSVNEQVMISRIDQQLKVNKEMVDFFATTNIDVPELKKYMWKYIEIITTVSSILLIKEGSKDSLRKKQELWQFLKNTDLKLYKKLRRGLFGQGVNLPGKMGRKTAISVYKVTQRIYGFN